MTEDPLREPDEPSAAEESSGRFDEDEIEILGFEGAAEEEDQGKRPGAEAESRADRESEHEAEIAELQDSYLRLRADFDNFRKRMEREREEVRRFALAEPIRELLAVVDNLERAAVAQGKPEDLRRGVEMIARQLADTLRRFGLAEVRALGAPFDPNVHEAVAREESPKVAMPTVIDELQRGYLLHDRLLRPAMVRVAVPPEDRSGADAEEGATEPATAARTAVTGEDS